MRSKAKPKPGRKPTSSGGALDMRSHETGSTIVIVIPVKE